MYKTTTRAAQARALGSVLNAHHNSAGIDPTTFKPPASSPEASSSDQRIAKARQRKITLQADLAKLNARISNAMSTRTLTGQPAPRKAWATWQTEKTKIISDIHETEVELSTAKLASAQERAQSKQSQQ